MLPAHHVPHVPSAPCVPVFSNCALHLFPLSSFCIVWLSQMPKVLGYHQRGFFTCSKATSFREQDGSPRVCGWVHGVCFTVCVTTPIWLLLNSDRVSASVSQVTHSTTHSFKSHLWGAGKRGRRNGKAARLLMAESKTAFMARVRAGHQKGASISGSSPTCCATALAWPLILSFCPDS